MNTLSKIIEDELILLKNYDKAIFLQGFFKTAKGQYAEGDCFLGIIVPLLRKTAKNYYKHIALNDISYLLESKWHECRLTALIMLVMKMEKDKNPETHLAIFDYYIANTKYINNWDLADLSAPHIMGKYLLDKDKTLLYNFAASGDLWKQRIAIVSTLYFVRKGHFDTSIIVAEKLLYHKHDLIHKAVGWVLREIGKKDKDILNNFLDKYYRIMPRTMLRYAIEHFGETERKHYMAK
jgi:3-methyladenine DNA glycosylase AlkD